MTSALIDLTIDQRAALCRFRAERGADWKRALFEEWRHSSCEFELEQLLNQFGPEWLATLKPTDFPPSARVRALSSLSQDEFSDLARLASKLSPENLACDGERTPEQVYAAELRIRRQWADAEERFALRPVSVWEVESEIGARSRRRMGMR